MTPRRFQVELAYQRKIEVIPEHWNIELRESGPDGVRLRIDACRQRIQVGRHRAVWRNAGRDTEREYVAVVVSLGEHIIRLIGPADCRLNLTAGNVEKRTIKA